LCALRTTAPATGWAIARWQQLRACADGPTSGASAVGRQGRSPEHRFPPRVAKWKRQVGYPVTVGRLGCSSTNFVPPERSAARDGPRTKPPGGNRLQCSGEPSGSACQTTPSGWPHKPVRKREFRLPRCRCSGLGTAVAIRRVTPALPVILHPCASKTAPKTDRYPRHPGNSLRTSGFAALPASAVVTWCSSIPATRKIRRWPCRWWRPTSPTGSSSSSITA
jgi:hypothetical protein